MLTIKGADKNNISAALYPRTEWLHIWLLLKINFAREGLADAKSPTGIYIT